MRFVTWHWAFWACMSAVTVLALMPATPHVPSTGWNKSNHLLAFTVLAVLGLWTYPTRTVAVLTGLLGFGTRLEGGDKRQEMRRLQPKKSRYKSRLITAFLTLGGADGTRTRDPRRDRPVF